MNRIAVAAEVSFVTSVHPQYVLVWSDRLKSVLAKAKLDDLMK